MEVLRLEDAEGLEQELAEFGVAADITYVPVGSPCAPERFVPVAREPDVFGSMGSDGYYSLEPGAWCRQGR